MQAFDTLLTGPRVLRVTIHAPNDVQAHKMAYHLQLAYGYREYFLKEGERVMGPAKQDCSASLATLACTPCNSIQL